MARAGRLLLGRPYRPASPRLRRRDRRQISGLASSQEAGVLQQKSIRRGAVVWGGAGREVTSVNSSAEQSSTVGRFMESTEISTIRG